MEKKTRADTKQHIVSNKEWGVEVGQPILKLHPILSRHSPIHQPCAELHACENPSWSLQITIIRQGTQTAGKKLEKCNDIKAHEAELKLALKRLESLVYVRYD